MANGQRRVLTHVRVKTGRPYTCTFDPEAKLGELVDYLLLHIQIEQKKTAMMMTDAGQWSLGPESEDSEEEDPGDVASVLSVEEKRCK